MASLAADQPNVKIFMWHIGTVGKRLFFNQRHSTSSFVELHSLNSGSLPTLNFSEHQRFNVFWTVPLIEGKCSKREKKVFPNNHATQASNKIHILILVQSSLYVWMCAVLCIEWKSVRCKHCCFEKSSVCLLFILTIKPTTHLSSSLVLFSHPIK